MQLPLASPDYLPWLESSSGLEVLLSLSDGPEVPAAIATTGPYQAALRMWEEKVAAGQAFDGPVLRPTQLTLRPGRSLSVTAQVYRYVEFQALSAYYLATGTSPKFLNDPLAPVPAISVAVGVLTADGLALAHRRALHLGSNPGKRSLALGEGLLPEDTGDIRAAARRCLAEELGLVLPKAAESAIRVLAVGRMEKPPAWVVLCVLDARALRADGHSSALLANARHAPDNNEVDGLQGLPLEQAAAYLDKQPHTQYSPTMARLLLHTARRRCMDF